jgi:5-formyltetrahydrofolate cyclo-ligase
MTAKGDLRRDYLLRRRNITSRDRHAWDDAIRVQVLALPEVAGAGAVLTYVSVATEVDTHGIVEGLLERGTRVIAPQMRDDSDEMRWGAVMSLTDLDRGLFGILQPREELNGSPPSNAPVLVPCVAFTDRGDRLGRGGGHFDRFLAGHRGPRIGLAYECQRAESIPREPHDIALDVIVTESQVRRRR